MYAAYRTLNGNHEEEGIVSFQKMCSVTEELSFRKPLMVIVTDLQADNLLYQKDYLFLKIGIASAILISIGK